MNNYLLLSLSEIAGPVTMEKPDLAKFSSPYMWMERLNSYDQHLDKLLRYQVIGLFPNKNVGETVVEDVDFRLQHQWYGDLAWWNCMPDAYYSLGTRRKKRIVAIPVSEFSDKQCKHVSFKHNDGDTDFTCDCCDKTKLKILIVKTKNWLLIISLPY